MKAKRLHLFAPDYAIPPGATLLETMEALGMTQREFAERTDLTVQTLNRIFKGEQPITFETANRLELVTGTPASFWNSLEAQYRELLTKRREAEQLRGSLGWLNTIPVKELITRGVVEDSEDPVARLRNVLRFYAVSSVEAWHTIWDAPAVAARRSTCFESAPGPTSAWLRLGQLEAAKVECLPYDHRRFLGNLQRMRALTREEPATFLPKLRSLCAEAGVALVLIKEIPKAPWSGAAEWLTSEKAMLLLNLRGKSEDKFWFSLFHEAGHILHDSKQMTFISGCADYTNDPTEKEADRFAAELLIPSRLNAEVGRLRTESEIIAFANAAGVSPGIVVGRYHHLTQRWSAFTKLRRKFVWQSR